MTAKTSGDVSVGSGVAVGSGRAVLVSCGVATAGGVAEGGSSWVSVGAGGTVAVTVTATVAVTVGGCTVMMGGTAVQAASKQSNNSHNKGVAGSRGREGPVCLIMPHIITCGRCFGYGCLGDLNGRFIF